MDPTLRNEVIDVLNGAGLYHAALGAEPAADEARGVPGPLLALIQINLAESDYNLGGWDRAEVRLSGLDEEAERLPITRAGLLQQRAWIAAHQARGPEAMALCERVSIHWLPRPYHAEFYFTRAVALLAVGRVAAAEGAVRAGQRVALRRSSRRNAVFLLARVAAAREDWAAAERFCRHAAAEASCGQGGDGLLLWGEALSRLGRPLDALAAWELARERDPESESARLAAARADALRAARPSLRGDRR
jgi:tetratricopeptide (TPR) repeat protein